MTIRDAVEADLPAIVEIYNAAVPGRLATGDLDPVSVQSRQAWFREHTPADFILDQRRAALFGQGQCTHHLSMGLFAPRIEFQLALGIGLLSGGYGQDELYQAGAYRVYQDPADLLRHLDEVGVRRAPDAG